MWKDAVLKLYFGSLAYKLWGENIPGVQKFIALHGFMDNAGSFDPMMEHFTNNDRCVACLDFPGHGWSSHLPSGIPYGPHMEQLACRALVQHLGWTKYNIIGHSMGAIRAQYYACAFPEDVQSVICIDGLIITLEMMMKSTSPYQLFGKQLDKFLDLQTKPIPAKEYESEEAIAARWETGADGLTLADAAVMMRRGAKRLDNGNYIFTRDPSLNVRINSILAHTSDSLITSLKILEDHNISTLFIRPTDGIFKDLTSNKINRFGINLYRKILESSDISVCHMEGSHYIHMQNPKEVVKTINSFLSTSQQQSSESADNSKL